MKKPLTKSVIKNEDVEEKPIDDDTKVLSQHGELKIPPQKYIFFASTKNQHFWKLFRKWRIWASNELKKNFKKHWFLAILIVQQLKLWFHEI